MLDVKLKSRSEFKTFERCELDRKRTSDEAIYTAPQKTDNKDYMNEIFAGLMWLG